MTLLHWPILKIITIRRTLSTQRQKREKIHFLYLSKFKLVIHVHQHNGIPKKKTRTLTHGNKEQFGLFLNRPSDLVLIPLSCKGFDSSR